MTTIRKAPIDTSLGDSIIDGLFGGLVAGLAMVLFLLAVAWAGGVAPDQALARFDLQSTPSPLVGGLIHLALSGVYGLAFGLLFWVFLRRILAGKQAALGALPGLLFGLLLWLLASSILLPVTSSPLQTLTAWSFATGHLLYGAILGWWVLRSAIHRQAESS